MTTAPREWAEPQLLLMVSALCHESFYTTGVLCDQARGIYVGWVARKHSFCDGMPVWNEAKDVSLVFSGEEFPEPGTTERLKKEGHVVGAEAPAYLVHLYEEDPSFPTGLNGRFHGLLTDRTRGTATLFNDRYGMHRLYYHEAKDAFYFAGEAKAILAVRPELRRTDPRGLGEFVTVGCVLENRTLFDRIRVLPPASAWAFRGGAIERKGTYFQARQWEEESPLEPEAYYSEIRRVFSCNLPRYFAGPERVGMSLTGGLDTRMIMAVHAPPSGSLPCYTFGGMFRDCQDVIVAREVARACGQTHQVIPVGQQFLSCFAKYAQRTVYLTDGCTDVSHSPDLYANERAREVAPVRMTGNYGGEILRRVRAFKPQHPSSAIFVPDLATHFRAAAASYAELIQSHPLTFAAFRQAPWHHYGLLALEQSQLGLRSPFLDNAFVRTVYRAPPSALASDEISLRLIADGNPALMQIRTDRGLGGRRRLGAQPALRNLIEFSVKAEYAYDYGMPQRVAQIDHVFSKLHLERLFLGRHKFYHFRLWYRDHLSGYLKETLLDRRSLSRAYLNRDAVETIVRSHVKGNRNYTLDLHKLLTLEIIHRLFIDL